MFYIFQLLELGIHVKRWWQFIYSLNPIHPKLFKKVRACYPSILSATQPRVTLAPKHTSLSSQQKPHVETKPYEGDSYTLQSLKNFFLNEIN
jgi:hypothetical protein